MPIDEGLEGFFGVAEDAIELQRTEDDIWLAARRGSLFVPDLAAKDWDDFCSAATKAETERRNCVPPGRSTLTEDEHLILKRADSCRDEQTAALLEKREELSRTVRPQSVDVDGTEEAAEVEKLLAEEFGDIGEWGNIDTSIGGGL